MLKFIDLFAGTGGIRIALEQVCKELGIKNKCVFSSEIDKKAAQSYELNFDENPFSDITKVTDFPDFDLMLAGFPCQTFSYAGKQRGFTDTRGTLFFDVERILKKKRPKYFLLENVRGLTTHDKGRTFQIIKDSLLNLGYRVEYLLLNSSNFGVPQNRVRIYIVGTLNTEIKITLKSNLGASDTHKFKAINNNLEFNFGGGRKEVNVSSILLDSVDKKYNCSENFMSQLGNVVGDDFNKLHGYRMIDTRGGHSIHSWELGLKGDCTAQEVVFMNLLIANRRKKVFGIHQDGKKLTEEQIKTFYHANDFKEVSESLLKNGYLSCSENKYNPVSGNMSFEVFKFLDPESISITLTASDCNRLGIVQNNIPRRITPRECARLQGYPDTYLLLDDDAAVYKQMGNGVSVPVVKSVLLDLFKNNFE